MHPTLGTETSHVFPKSATLRVTRVPSCGKNWELHQACDETGLPLTQLVPSLSFLLFIILVVRQRTPTHLRIGKFQLGMNKSILRRTGPGSDALLSHPGRQITGGHRTITHPDPTNSGNQEESSHRTHRDGKSCPLLGRPHL